MPNDPIPAHVCARMGVPEGSTWGHNAGEIRRMQQNAGMHPFRSPDASARSSLSCLGSWSAVRARFRTFARRSVSGLVEPWCGALCAL